MNRRLLQFLQAENITQAQLADTLSVARGSVSHILAGRNKPGYDFMESLLLHYPTLNLDWLMTGRGKMYRSDESPEGADPSQLNLFTPQQSPVEARRIEKITVFYSDSSFQDFIAKE